MRHFKDELHDFSKKGDWVLLILCLVTAGFGCICVASATNAPKFDGNTRYIIIQLVAIAIGVFLYAVVSSVDLEFLAEHQFALVLFNVFLLLLLIAFGTDNNTGNRRGSAAEAEIH